ncbi:MAG: hypothetical protein EXS36_16715 [Pedosphaera sp.]|nr:hypothetical protein [Pedosphaera sp.]
MSSPSQNGGQQLSEERLNALLTLLGDEDPAVWGPVRAQWVAGGDPALRWLSSRRLHPDPVIRRRAGEILDEAATLPAEGAFLGFLLRHGEHFDLEEAVWLFTCTRYPREKPDAWRALFDEYANEIRFQTPPANAGKPMLEAIRQRLFDGLGLRGNEADFYNPENSYPHRVIQRRLGNPLSLSLIHLFISRRLQLPVSGIGMPGHFICRYQSLQDEYYIDVFHGGTLLTRADCMKRLHALAVAQDDQLLLPISSRRILQRMIHNLYIIHKERKESTESNRLQRYLVALAG